MPVSLMCIVTKQKQVEVGQCFTRLDGSVVFDRVWKDYKQGFLSLSGKFWLGLDKIHRLTKERNKLRVELDKQLTLSTTCLALLTKEINTG